MTSAKDAARDALLVAVAKELMVVMDKQQLFTPLKGALAVFQAAAEPSAPPDKPAPDVRAEVTLPRQPTFLEGWQAGHEACLEAVNKLAEDRAYGTERWIAYLCADAVKALAREAAP